MNYSQYIVSSQWRSKHKEFLKRSHYRCAFFPFIKVGRGKRYNCHHMSYKNLGSVVGLVVNLVKMLMGW